MQLINGQPGALLPVGDRGLQYGDGLFETLLLTAGRIPLRERHFRRLADGCARLAIPLPEEQRLYDEVNQVCEGATEGVIKVIITRGSGSRGYRGPAAPDPTRIVSFHDRPAAPGDAPQAGIRVRYCDTRLGLNPALAGIKHLNRLEQVLARNEWDDPAIAEGLMMDTNGHVIEGTFTNVFMVSEERLVTSQLASSGVAGVMRGWILDHAADAGMRVQVCDLTPAMLARADELFVCNSIAGIWPVSQLVEQALAVGPVTRRLQSLVDGALA